MRLWKAFIAAFLSRKLLSVAVGLWLLIWLDGQHYDRVVALPDEKAVIAGNLTTSFIGTLGAVSALIGGYLGFNTLQTKYGVSGVAQSMASAVSETIDERRRVEVDEGRARHDDDLG